MLIRAQFLESWISPRNKYELSYPRDQGILFLVVIVSKILLGIIKITNVGPQLFSEGAEPTV